MSKLRDISKMEDFTKEDYALMDKIHDEMIAKVSLTDTSDETLIEAVKTLYSLGDEKEPNVTVCVSPLDMQAKASKITDNTSESWYGNVSDFYWIGYVLFGILSGIIEDDEDFQKAKTAIVDSGMWSMIALEGEAFVCRRPVKLLTDSEGEMHCLDGKAIEWPQETVDGKKVSCGSHFVHGVHFTPEQFRNMRKATMAEIIGWEDIDQRSALLRDRPVTELLESVPKTLIDETDECGGYRLWELDIPNLGKCRMLEYLSWSEVGGQRRPYAKYVPPTSEKCLETVASLRHQTVEQLKSSIKS